MFMPSSMKAAIRLWPNYLANLEIYKNTTFEEIQRSIMKRLWMYIRFTAPVHPGRDQCCLVIKWSSGQRQKYCLLWFRTLPAENEWQQRCNYVRWEGQVEEFKMSPSYKELLGIDGESIEFEWNIFPGFSSLQILQEIQSDVRKRNVEPEQFTDRNIFMPMFNDIDWTRKGNDGICMSNSEKVKEHAKRFSQGNWTFLDLGNEKSMELFFIHLKENGTLQPPKWWSDSKIPVIQYSRVSVLWVVGSWTRKQERHHTL